MRSSKYFLKIWKITLLKIAYNLKCTYRLVIKERNQHLPMFRFISRTSFLVFLTKGMKSFGSPRFIGSIDFADKGDNFLERGHYNGHGGASEREREGAVKITLLRQKTWEKIGSWFFFKILTRKLAKKLGMFQKQQNKAFLCASSTHSLFPLLRIKLLSASIAKSQKAFLIVYRRKKFQCKTVSKAK